MIWTDGDREGENIGQEVADICLKINRNLRVLRPRFSVILNKFHLFVILKRNKYGLSKSR